MSAVAHPTLPGGQSATRVPLELGWAVDRYPPTKRAAGAARRVAAMGGCA